MPTPVQIAAIVLALAGVALVISQGHVLALFDGGEAQADLLILAGALCWVIYTLGAQDFPAWSALRYTALSCALAVPSIALITGLATWVGSAHPPAWDTLRSVAGEMIYLILLAGVLAVLAWNRGIRSVGASGVLFINGVPVTALLIGWWQGRTLSAIELLGALMVMGALVLGNLGSFRHRTPKTRLDSR
jgi:drug/metabolite transporter (DMT)-like permease